MFSPAPPKPASAAASSTCRRSRRSPSTSSATCARRSSGSRSSPPARRPVRHADHRRPHGDTPQAERARFQREPPDILITTPESLYLLLTSNAREALRVDRHRHHRRDPRARARPSAARTSRSRSSGSRRSAGAGRSSASASRRRSARSTRCARFLGGAEPRVAVGAARGGRRARASASGPLATGATTRRPTTRSATSSRRTAHAVTTGRSRSSMPGRRSRSALTIEVPVEDMARLGRGGRNPERTGVGGDTRPSIWSSIHPRLVELIRAHRSTLIFVNSRRLAERLAGALQRAGRRDARPLASRIDRAARSAWKSKIC